MITVKTVGIAGLGLIGGSFAKAYKENSDVKVLGVDLNNSITHLATVEGAIDGVLTKDNIGECDLIIPALYPDTIHALDKNFILKEIPIRYRDRTNGSVSKLNTFSDGLKVLKTIARLFKEYKPMIFFGIIGTLFLIISFIFGIPVFYEYFQTGLVPRFPTLIFSGLLLTISMLMYICGIILEVVVRKHRQLFEYVYINTKRNK